MIFPIEQHIPEKNIKIFNNNEYQVVSSAYNGTSTYSFPYQSNKIENSYILNNRNSIDTAWETGNSYIADKLGYIRQLNKYGTLLNEFIMNIPLAVSIIQREPQMIVTNVVEEKGLWAINANNLHKFDNQLNEELSISGFSNLLFVTWNKNDDGCFVIDDTSIHRFSNNGSLIASTGAIIDIIDINCNSFGELYVMTKTNLTRYDGNLNILSTIMFSSLFPVNTVVSCFDIDTSSDNQFIYLSGWLNTIRIVKLSRTLTLSSSTTIVGDFPYILKISQNPTSNTFHILSDQNKMSEFII